MKPDEVIVAPGDDAAVGGCDRSAEVGAAIVASNSGYLAAPTTPRPGVSAARTEMYRV
jgi:hypothetical protein